MPSPFPGMNPYLEHPDLWPGVHHLLISEMVRLINPQIRPKYYAAVEVRTYETENLDEHGSVLIGIPDLTIRPAKATTKPVESNIAVIERSTVPITATIPMSEIRRQAYLQIREVGTKALITTVEILSPTNKRPGKGRQKYEAKRHRVFESNSHLVEIDLLRQYQPMICFTKQPIDCHYRVLVSRSDRRPQAELYAINLPDLLPIFALPLKPEDQEQEPLIDLQKLLNNIYDIGDYDAVIDYNQDVIPPLATGEILWLDNLLKTQGLRS